MNRSVLLRGLNIYKAGRNRNREEIFHPTLLKIISRKGSEAFKIPETQELPTHLLFDYTLTFEDLYYKALSLKNNENSLLDIDTFDILPEILPILLEHVPSDIKQILLTRAKLCDYTWGYMGSAGTYHPEVLSRNGILRY